MRRHESAPAVMSLLLVLSGCWSALNTYSIAPGSKAVTVDDIGKALARAGQNVEELDKRLGVVSTSWETLPFADGSGRFERRFVATVAKSGDVGLRMEKKTCRGFNGCLDSEGTGDSSDQKTLDDLAAKLATDLEGTATIVKAAK